MKFIMLSIIGLVISSTPVEAADTIKVGYLPALTGPNAADSVLEMKLVKLAEKQVNAAGGVLGKKIEVLYIDNKSTPQGMLDAFNEAVKNQVAFVVTNSKSPQIMSLPIASKEAGIAVVIGGTNPKLCDDKDNMFLRMRPNDDVMSGGVVQFVKDDTPHKKIGIIHDSASNGASMANQQAKYAKDIPDLQIVARESFVAQKDDMNKQFDAMKKAKVEVVLGNISQSVDAILLYQKGKELQSEMKLIMSPGAARAQALKGAGPSADGAYVATEFIPGTAELKKVSDEYKAEYKEEVDPYALWIYDGFMVGIEGLKLANGNPKGVRAAVLKQKKFASTRKPIEFDDRGDAYRSVSISRIEKGNLIPVKSVTVK